MLVSAVSMNGVIPAVKNSPKSNSVKEQYKEQVTFGTYTPQKGSDAIAVSTRKLWGDKPGANVVKPAVDAIKRMWVKEYRAAGKSETEALALAEKRLVRKGYYDGSSD